MNRFILFFVLLLFESRVAYAQLSGGLPPLTPNRTSSLPKITLVKIGHVGPISGVIGHLGIDNERGAKMAIEELNASGTTIGGRAVKFELVTEDDAADPRQAVIAAQRIVSARVSGVIGHLNSGSTIPASSVYNNAGVPQISPSATNPKFTRQGVPGSFRVIADDTQLARKLAESFGKSHRAKRYAVIDDGTAYGAGIADEFKKNITAIGGAVVANEFTNDRAIDFREIITSLKARKADIIFFGGMDTVAGPLLKQMKQMGLTFEYFVGGDGICTSDLAKLAGDGLTDGTVVCAEAGGVEEAFAADMNVFRSKFKSKFNADVQLYSPYVYDSVKVMVQSMVIAGSPEPSRYLPVLKKISYRGVTGNISFDDLGDIKSGAITGYTYISGKREQVGVYR
jgi:branched-chain amino acid transport system substrate-binding protein